MTALSTGLFQVEAQRVTLLATGKNLFMLPTARLTTTMMSVFLPKEERAPPSAGQHMCCTLSNLARALLLCVLLLH